jgi:hypothetical protein
VPRAPEFRHAPRHDRQPRGIVAGLEKFAGQARLHRLESRKDGERFMATVERR